MSRLTGGRALLVVVLSLALGRAWLAGAVGLGDDEAYYWLWGQHLAWGYYDHPPLVAWLIAVSTALLGDTALAVRLPSILSGLLASWALWSLGLALGSRRVAARAVLAFQVVPVFALGTLFASPDMAFLALFLWALRAALGRRWVALGLLAGLAALARFHAIFLPLAVLGWLLATDRPALRRPGPWLSAGIAALVASPIFAWNASHGWVTFGFQLADRHGSGPGVLRGVGLFLASQLLFYSPVLVILSLWGLRAWWREPRARLLVWAAAPMLVLFAMDALFSEFKAHWTAAAWALLLLAGAASAGRRWWRVGVILAALMTGLLVAQTLTPLLPIRPARADITNELYGWDAVGERLLALQRADPRLYAAGHMYQIAAQIAFATAGSGLEVARLGGRHDQFDLWPRPDLSRPALVVEHDRYPLALDTPGEAHALGFAACLQIDTAAIMRRRRVVNEFRIWRCEPGQAPK